MNGDCPWSFALAQLLWTFCVVGLLLLGCFGVGPEAFSTSGAPLESDVSGSAADGRNFIGSRMRLSEKVIRESVLHVYDLVSDDAVAARWLAARAKELCQIAHVLPLLNVAYLMQYSGQKNRQAGLRDAAAQHALGAAGPSQAAEQRASEFGDVMRLAVGERVLHRVPGRLDRIDLGRIAGQLLQMQPRVSIADLIQALAMVDRGAVPDHDDVTAKILEQIPEKVVHFIARDVLRAQPEVEPDPASLRADREPADDRDPGAVVAVVNDRCLTDRHPGTPDGGDQHEARFVDKDEVGTQPRRVFFNRGQSLRFHFLIRSSSRSSARRSSFWQLKPRSCSKRATWPR